MDSFSRLLWWLFASSAGARTRAEIVGVLREEPRNAQQLALALGMDYSTIRHHLKVLQQNRLVESSGDHYGQVYSVTAVVEERWAEFEAIGRRRDAREGRP